MQGTLLRISALPGSESHFPMQGPSGEQLEIPPWMHLEAYREAETREMGKNTLENRACKHVGYVPFSTSKLLP